MAEPPAGDLRAQAVRVLVRVGEGAMAEAALGAHLDATALGPADRRLLTELVYGTLRQALRLDHAVAAYVRGDPRTLAAETRWALRLGLYQLWFLDDVPDFAAVHETVAAVKALRPGEAGLVNAVLRRAAREGEPDLPRPPQERLSVAAALPRWLVARWWRTLGEEGARRRALAFGRRPRLTLRTNEALLGRAELLARLTAAGAEAAAGRLSPLAVTLPHGSVRELPGYAEGWFQVQGEGSQLAALAVEAPEGGLVADLCAGLGTKSLALLARPAGYDVVAADVDAGRLAAIPGEAARLRLRRPRRVVADARRPPQAFHGRFDGVLVDAPCTALGLLGRHPEIRLRRREADVAALARRELAILTGASRTVRPGGVLVYAVCTLEPEETEGVLRAFLAEAPEFARDEDWGRRGERSLDPGREDVDEGFFVARLRRRRATVHPAAEPGRPAGDLAGGKTSAPPR